MRENHFELYKSRVFKTILETERKLNTSSLGDTLLRHYFNSGYSEKSAATAIIEVVSV